KARNYLRLQDILRPVAVEHAYDGNLDVAKAHEAATTLAEQWRGGVRLHRERQLANAEGQSEDAAERIEEQATKELREIDEAEQAVHRWLDAQDAEGNPIEMQRTPLEKFAAVATLDEIRDENDFNLNISRYVDATEPPPVLDVAEELAALRTLEDERNRAEARMNELLAELGYRPAEVPS
ncbi:MAG: N-6 DNA methylase, partial [Planctomycetota bacterium]